ncbi:MAG: hypothetical protein LM583_10170 [Desulfurococcaceae archaeon]|nr:hypothetical protein [Desulfurococcaceae archaeon]
MSQSLTVSFTEDEAKKILDTRQKLMRWYNLVTQGVIGALAEEGLKNAIMEIADLSNKLYGWYVPPFKITKVPLTAQEVENVINDLKAKGGLVAWFPLDSQYFATSLEEFKKIISWDWTDHLHYEINSFDCENFAFYFASRIARMFGINAIGVILDYSSAHAYNLVIVKDSQGVRYYLFEPQNDSIFTYDQRDQSFYAMKQYIMLL